MTAAPNDILAFWYTPETRPTAENPFGHSRLEWFRSSPEFDQQIEASFLSTYEVAARGELDDWSRSPMDALALVIVLDQFPRNMFRDSPRAFSTDHMAVQIARRAISKKYDAAFNDIEKQFLYMPFQHSEDPDIQRRSLALHADIGIVECLESAQRHCEIIQRFGRFPHRNAILGRTSTVEEIAFLQEPNSSF